MSRCAPWHSVAPDTKHQSRPRSPAVISASPHDPPRFDHFLASVRNRLLLAITSALIVGMVIAIAWGVADDINATNRVREQIGNMTARTQREMTRQLRGVTEGMSHIGTNYVADLRDPELCARVIDLTIAHSAGAQMWVLDEAGAERCGSAPLRADVRQQATAAAAADTTEHIITSGGQVYLAAAYAEGVLVHTLTPVLSPPAAGASAAIISDGRFLVRVPTDSGQLTGSAVPDELAQQIGTSGYFTATGPDGVERIYDATSVPGTDWQLLVGVSTEGPLASRQAAVMRGVALGVGILGLAGLLGVMLYRGVDRPLRELQTGAEAAARAQETRIRIAPGAPREVRQLAGSINHLLGRARADRERLQAILASMPIFVFAVDRNGIIRQVEGRDPRRIGSRPSVVGQSIHKLAQPYPDLQPLFTAVAGGQPASTRVMIDGAMHTLHLRPMSNGSWAGVTVDQSEQYRAEMRLAAAETRLRAILEHLPAVAYTYELLSDGSYRMLYVSPRVEEVLGYSVDELMRTYRRHTLVDPRDLARVRAQEARAARNGEPFSVECRMVRKDGRSIWVNDTEAVAVRSGDRDLIHGLIIDIEDRKRAEAALAEERRRLQLLFSHAAVGVALVGRGGRMLVANSAFERLAGSDIGQMQRIAPRRWIHPDDRHRLGALLRHIDSGESGGIEVRTHPDLGAERWVRLTASTVSEDGVPAAQQWVVIAEDVTDRRQMEERLDHERRRLDELLNSIGDAFVALDADLRLSYMNEAAARMLELQPAAALGCQLTEIFPEQVTGNEDWFALLRRAASDRIAGELEIEGAPGRWISMRIYPALESSVSVFFTDSTEAHHAEQELRESEERYRHLIEVSPETIVVHSEGKIAYVNPAGLRMMRIKRLEDVIGTSAIEWVDPRDRPRVAQRISELHSSGADGEIREERFVRPDGSLVTVEVTASTLTWEGKPAIQIVARDTTERRRLEAQVRQAQKMEVVGRLAGGVAHDLNNLLTGLRGYNELLLESLPEGSEPAQYASLVSSAGERASAMTRQLLSFARQYPADPSVIDVNDSIAEWLPMLRRLAGTRIDTTHEAGSRLPAVLIDKHQFEQAIFNLAVNARDAMPNGGSLTIRTSLAEPPTAAEDGAEWVHVEVIDTGVGMSDEEVSRAFEPFWTTKAPGEGTGLGLATVYGTVTQAGGLIEIDSTPGRGTTFSIWLPPSKETATLPEPSTPARPAESDSAGTILLVDDDETVRHIAGVTLERAGYRVICAQDASEAISMWDAEENPPDALVSDVMMPETNGVDLARILLGREPTLRVLMISGYAEDAMLPSRIRAAGHSFLPKPFLPGELMDAVSELLRPPTGELNGNGKTPEPEI